MFLTNFIKPQIAFGSSGGSGGSSGGGGGGGSSSPSPRPKPKPPSNSSSGSKGGKSSDGGSKPLAPKTSPRPRPRPPTVEVGGFQGPNMDGSAGYSKVFIKNPDGSLGDQVGANTSNGDPISNGGKTIGGKDYSNPTSPPVTAPTTGNDNPRTDPVTAPETTDPRDGVGGGRDGGGSARRKASTTKEDNVSVRRKAEGVERYKRRPEATSRTGGGNRMAIPKNNNNR